MGKQKIPNLSTEILKIKKIWKRIWDNGTPRKGLT